ncbi:MAG: thiamine-phosphate kinase [Phycisphaerales bacterium]
MTIRESDLLRHIYGRSQGMPAHVRLGPGDDCALVHLEGDTLATTDQFVEGRHFQPDWPIDIIARNAVGRSVSDIAAMGGRPTCALAAGALRAGFEHADQLFDTMARWARHWNCPLIGGDIAVTDGPTVLTVTVLGAPHATRAAVTRSGARPGDAVYVTGAVGKAKAASWKHPVEPRIEESAWLCDALGSRLHAMIDLSDGLGRDAARIAEASGVRIELDADALPLAHGIAEWRAAAGAGDDYELCFCAAGEVPPVAPSGVPITRIGRVVEGTGCTIDAADATNLGWEHTDR